MKYLEDSFDETMALLETICKIPAPSNQEERRAEFCLDCFNKYISKKEVTEKDVIMDYDLCEECGEWKQCVIIIKEKNIFKKVNRFFVMKMRSTL